MLNTNGFQEIDKLVQDGIIGIDAANDMKGKMMKKTLTENNIIMPTITEHTRKGKLQYTGKHVQRRQKTSGNRENEGGMREKMG